MPLARNLLAAASRPSPGSGICRSGPVVDRTLSGFDCRADPELLEIFGFQLTRGQLSRDVMTAVITEGVARMFLGEADPIGQTITLVDAAMANYTITGVLQDIPK